MRDKTTGKENSSISIHKDCPSSTTLLCYNKTTSMFSFMLQKGTSTWISCSFLVRLQTFHSFLPWKCFEILFCVTNYEYLGRYLPRSVCKYRGSPIGRDPRLKVCAGGGINLVPRAFKGKAMGTRLRWDAKNNPRDYGIARNLGSGLRDWKTLLGTLSTGSQFFATQKRGLRGCGLL